MRLFKQLLDFYINSSIHVALAVCSLTWITLKEYNIAFDSVLLNFIFFATITGYNFVKYFGFVKWHHRRLVSWLTGIQIVSFLCFILMIYFGLHLKGITLLAVFVLGILNFLYAIPLLPKRIYLDANQNLRSISGLKVYVIAFVWSGVTVLLPILNNGLGLSMDVIITFFQRFVLVVVLMLPFEIRDLQFDNIRLATIPQRIGVRRTKIIGVLMMIVFFFLEFLKDRISEARIVPLLIITIITMGFVAYSREKQNRYYSGFWVESIPIIWILLVSYIS